MSNKLTIKEEMRSIDVKDRTWYNSLTDEEKKKVGIWVLMRYASSVKHGIKDFEEHYLEWTNELVNVHFNTLRHHPELQYQLLQAVGLGKVQYHPWIAPGKKGTDKPLFKFFKEKHPEYNDDVPLYTKTPESDIFYAAGWYAINFEKGWKHGHGPKYSTLTKYGYKGPFKTEIKCRQVLRQLNKKKKED